ENPSRQGDNGGWIGSLGYSIERELPQPPIISGYQSVRNILDFLLLAVLAAMILLLISQNRKRKRDAENLVSSLAVGANVLLHAGIKGKVVAIDGDDIELETTPGVKLRVVKQAIRGIETAEGK
ncbi:MAG TPA: preprotein translocase subunit YajC, partial [Candidatus Aquiluna sp.]|nr:preprotein translocase subunit YajC [Aquiluna sp.]